MNFWESMINKRLGSRVIGILLSGVMVTGLVLPALAEADTSGLALSDVISKVDTNNLANANLTDAEAQLLRDILQQIDSGAMDAAELGDIDVQVLRDIIWQIDSASSGKAEAEAEPGPQASEEAPAQTGTERPASDAPVTDTGNSEAADAANSEVPAENAAPAEDTQPVKTITAPEEITEPVEPEEDVDEELVIDYPEGVTKIGSDEEIALSDEQIQEILGSIPEGLSAERVGVVLNAYSLVNKINYFWGGKSYTLGWDERWGNTAYVNSGGSSSSGTYRSYGLDCSGYVLWAFCNASGYAVSQQVGLSTRYQWGLSQETAWEDAQPGDLAFFYDPNTSGSINHVGIVVGWDYDGELLVAHCSSSKNTVAVTRATDTGFKYIRTPDIYSNESFVSDSYTYKGLGTYLLWQSTAEIEISDSELLDTESDDTELENTEPVILTIDDIKIGDLIFSQIPSWETGATVGTVTGFDEYDNVLVSYPAEKDDANITDGTGDTANIAEGTEDEDNVDSENEGVTEESEFEVISVPVDQLDYTNVRRIESSGALSYLKAELPIYTIKTIYGGKEAAEKAKDPYEMEESQGDLEID